MTAHSFVQLLSYLEPIFCALVLVSLVRSDSVRKFVALTTLLSIRLTSGIVCLSILKFSGHGIERHLAYQTYFYVYWISYAAEAILSLIVIYSIFKLAMAPLKGLATLGILVFRWAGAISVAVAIGMAIAPHASRIEFMVAMVTQLQQTTSILTLCLLLFVCFAIRPMGLTYQSRIFGVSLGLGIMATTNLVDLAWFAHNSNMYSSFNIVTGATGCIALLMWSAYFTLPEPKRRMIILPTTSPFLRWNQISMALGDDPGFVAVGGIPPEMFAPAEIEVMLRASAKMAPGMTSGVSSGVQTDMGMLSHSA
jgi:hypothetical protein